MEEYKKKLDKNLEIIKKEKLGKEMTDERQALMDKLKALNEEKSRLESELKKYEDSNPVEYEHMKKSIEVCEINYQCQITVIKHNIGQLGKFF